MIALDSIGDALASADLSGQITYSDAAAEVLTGWSLKDARGPPVDATTRRRSSTPMRQTVPPGRLIAIAEDCGLLIPIGRRVRQGCRQARAWQAVGLPPLSIAMNISATELRAPDFVSGVRDVLKETRLEPRYLELELIETGLMDDSRSVADMLRELKEIGVLLALDDFGTVRFGIGKSLHMEVFAEGVETRQQLELLQRRGCRLNDLPEGRPHRGWQ